MKTAIQKAPKPLTVEALTATSNAVERAFIRLAKDAGSVMTTPVRVSMFEKLKLWEDHLKAIVEITRTTLLSYVLSDGETVSEKGTKVVKADGWKLEARPRNTGFDDAKVEALLRAKRIDVGMGMDQIVSYKTAPERLELMVKHNFLTDAELNNCRHELAYSLQRPVHE